MLPLDAAHIRSNSTPIFLGGTCRAIGAHEDLWCMTQTCTLDQYTCALSQSSPWTVHALTNTKMGMNTVRSTCGDGDNRRRRTSISSMTHVHDSCPSCCPLNVNAHNAAFTPT
eukprot:TRINITY_DN14474_c0_g2_i1.p1 TRINITY_DN14474_c0_g2~~TRINITY_DN14474_c0_g2_i1.p1  ORF type:complete len:113 (-),score=0.75 TRINITY_DN14474_c0_g2_i1:91-429(-)